ncbi:hypothetical protein [Numidum massiliense]|uniref:hypothetical protein n=1 Tax=Numidum massiliense TaxID=1522315 RepID=UPI00164E4098|nr:hypothetical protein [Numidum massiliense]
METRQWALSQIDEMDVHFYFDLLEFKHENTPQAKRARARKRGKVVPIDKVF